MAATLGLGFEDGGYFRVRELLYKDVCE